MDVVLFHVIFATVNSIHSAWNKSVICSDEILQDVLTLFSKNLFYFVSRNNFCWMSSTGEICTFSDDGLVVGCSGMHGTQRKNAKCLSVVSTSEVGARVSSSYLTSRFKKKKKRLVTHLHPTMYFGCNLGACKFTAEAKCKRP